MQLVLCSCLIARNLLSGLKTCMEISSYMHSGGVSMPHGSIVAPSSIMEEKGKFDADCTVRITTSSVSIFFILHSCVLTSFCYFLFGGEGRIGKAKIKFSICNIPDGPTCLDKLWFCIISIGYDQFFIFKKLYNQHHYILKNWYFYSLVGHQT